MSMEKKIDEIKETLFEIKMDTKECANRISNIEKSFQDHKKGLEPVQRAYTGAKWSIGALLTLGTLAALASRFI